MKLPVYLDNNATTPLDPRVIEAMLAVLREHYGNPASKTHSYGWYAEELVAIAREQVAKLIQAEPDEIIFTSGATESNNLALAGCTEMLKKESQSPVRIVSVVTEHKSVIDPLTVLKAAGDDIAFIPVDSAGLVGEAEFERALTRRPQIVSIMHANNEIGIVHDIPAFAKRAQEGGAIFHCDATQALGKIEVNVKKLGVDLLSLSAHKIYGPKGIGALYVRRGSAARGLNPLLFGGGHESGYRSGTLNVAGIVGFGTACEIIEQEGKAICDRLQALTSQFWDTLVAKIPEVILNGALKPRIPGNLNFALPQVNNGLLIGAIQSKLAVSISSACTSGSKTPSFVLAALGLPVERQNASIRVGIGRFNTEEEILFAAETLADAATTLRKKVSS